MKKFLKLKLDHEENEIKNINNVAADPPLTPYTEKCETTQELQPPLPLEPQVDNQIVFMDEESNKTSDMLPNIPDTRHKSKAEHTSKESVCKDFIRGTCTKSGCKYAHKNDVTHNDHHRAYTFCRNFQSRVCTHACCKYVHATVFEEQEYYRTHYLPPHALAHIHNSNNSNAHKPSNIGCGSSKTCDKRRTVNLKFPPPPLQNEEKLEKQDNLMMSYVSTDTMTAQPAPMSSTAPLPSNPSNSSTKILKRERRAMGEHSNPVYHMDSSEPAAKECKRCNITELRCHYYENEVERMRMAKKELNKSMSQLDKKNEKLNIFIQILLLKAGTLPNSTQNTGKFLSEKIDALRLQ